MLDVEGGAERVELMFASCGPLAQAKEPISELLSIIGQNSADADWAGTLQVAQEAARIGCRLCIENANEHPAGRPINGNEKIAAAAFIGHLGQVFHVDMNVARLIGFEATVFWPRFLDLQAAQVAHTMTTQARGSQDLPMVLETTCDPETASEKPVRSGFLALGLPIAGLGKRQLVSCPAFHTSKELQKAIPKIRRSFVT